MADIEHEAVKNIAVVRNQRRHRLMDASHLRIGAFAGGTGNGDLRQRSESDMLRIRAAALHILLHLKETLIISLSWNTAQQQGVDQMRLCRFSRQQNRAAEAETLGTSE